MSDMIDPKANKKRVVAKGRRAYYAGATIIANPYDPESEHAEWHFWREGWTAASDNRLARIAREGR